MTVKSVESSLAALSDDNYLLQRAKLCLENDDPNGAKCWMLTAKTMFPNNFAIQYEAYQLQRNEAEREEKTSSAAVSAAQDLDGLIQHFGAQKPAPLLDELLHMVEALKKEPGADDVKCKDDANAHARRIYGLLPRSTQQRILLESAYEVNVLEQTALFARRLLMALDRFPELVPEQGPHLVEALLKKCLNKAAAAAAGSVAPTEKAELRELFVREVCPRLLLHPQFQLDKACLTDVLALIGDHALHWVDAAASGGGAQSGESNPWPKMLASVEQIGRRLNWRLTDGLSGESAAALGQRIYHYSQQQGKQQPDNELYSVLQLLFLRALADYVTEMQHGQSSVLIEAFVTAADSPDERSAAHQQKRRRTTDDERRIPLITHGEGSSQQDGNEDHATPLVKAFMLAYRFYDLIRSNPIFDTKFQSMRPTPSAAVVFTGFYADVALYQGQYRDALQFLRALPTGGQQSGTSVYNTACQQYIKMASAEFCAGNQSAMATHISKAVACAPTAAAPSDEAVDERKPTSSILVQSTSLRNRHVHFLPCTLKHLLQYCTRLLVFALKERGLQPTMHGQGNTDQILGHLIVLLQYVFPEEKELFFLLLHRIRLKDTFSYPGFCQYVIHVDFLEEFAFMMNDKATKVILDIVTPTSSSVTPTSTRRMGTRGENRDKKEEIRTALIKQMVRSWECLDKVIADFFTKCGDSLTQCLL